MAAIQMVALVLASPAASEATHETPSRATSLGFSLGTPAGINIVFAKDLPTTTLTLTGGGARPGDHGIYGVQVAASLVRSERSRNFRSLNLIGGYSFIDHETWTYGGVEGFFSWRAFFVAPGLTAGTGDFSSPQFSLQTGLLWAL